MFETNMIGIFKNDLENIIVLSKKPYVDDLQLCQNMHDFSKEKHMCTKLEDTK